MGDQSACTSTSLSIDRALVAREEEAAITTNWFVGLRTRIAQIVMPEWLSSLGDVGIVDLPQPLDPVDTPTTSDEFESAVAGIAFRQKVGRVGRSQSEHPSPIVPVTSFDYFADSLKSMSLEADGRTPTEDDARKWAQFWDNLAPGHNYHDTLELQHFGPIARLRNADRQGLGEGHDFLSEHLMHPTWCDKCGDFIWGFVRQALKCNNCNYTCHYKCRQLVTLDCSAVRSTEMDSGDDQSWHTATSEELALFGIGRRGTEDTDDDTPDGTSDITDLTSLDADRWHENDEFAREPSHTVNGEALRSLVDEYNADCNGLAITVHEDDYTFYGYVQVHMNFGRPISIVASEEGTTVFDVMGSGGTTSRTMGMQSIHSFYLPRNTVKTLYIDSTTCTREMIVALLRKFRVADNPRKFALYSRCTHDTTEGKTLLSKVTRISDDAYPLRIALNWGATSSKRFLLQENETGDILWEAFEVPELNNFLKILTIEQSQYVDQIRRRYEAYKLYVRAEMVQRGMHNKILSSSFSCYSDEEARKTPTKPHSDVLPSPSAVIDPSSSEEGKRGGGIRRATSHISSTASSSFKYEMKRMAQRQGKEEGDAVDDKTL